MENVGQVVAPIVAKSILENIFNLYVSFLSHFSIKIVSQKMVILSSLSQKLVSGFSQKSFFPQCSHTRTRSFSVSLAVCLFPLLSIWV